MFERILVAFDGTPPSQHACEVALEIAARFRASVTVVTVHPPSKELTDGHLESLVPVDSEGRSLAVLLEEMKVDAKRRGIRSLDAVFVQGEVVPSILAYLREHPHDLTVTGSRGLSRGKRFFLGSVSSGLVGEAPCPVLVVRPEPAGAAMSPPPGVSPPAKRK